MECQPAQDISVWQLSLSIVYVVFWLVLNFCFPPDTSALSARKDKTDRVKQLQHLLYDSAVCMGSFSDMRRLRGQTIAIRVKHELGFELFKNIDNLILLAMIYFELTIPELTVCSQETPISPSGPRVENIYLSKFTINFGASFA